MALQAIIIRADGALVETEDLRRAAYGQVFAEAGFDWPHGRADFLQSAKLGSGKARIASYVRQQLKGRPETADLSQLICAMHRRTENLFSDFLADAPLEARPGMRDLVAVARAENVKVAVVGNLSRDDVGRVVGKALGARYAPMIDVVVARADAANCDAESAEADDEAMACRRALNELGVPPEAVLVLESTLTGLRAAHSVGCRVAGMRAAFAAADLPELAEFEIIDDLPGLVPRADRCALDPLNEDERAQLLSTLARLHDAGGNGAALDLRSDAMLVSDILKTKGASVKSIEPTATMRALAHALRAEKVGVMVVLDSAGTMKGIISERDLARGIAEFGADLPEMLVADLMTTAVVTCRPHDALAAVAKTMTQRRIRHLPVLVDGRVTGLISIGDVLKYRLDEVKMEADVLRDFARARR